jgi:ubiquinone/menaquinone biosynthesis C-methylase UbiE
MGFYETRILPHLIDLACGSEDVSRERMSVVPRAEGRVLEVGMGSGLNIPFYSVEKVELIWGLEPSEGMRKKAAKNLANAPFDVRLIGEPGEDIPLDDDSADTVLLTFTLCSIADWRKALTEMRRVLRPGGKLIFCEHGESPDENVRKWQERINPLWKKIAGGCNLNRNIPKCIEEGGFRIREIETGYTEGPKIASFKYRGFAD